MNIHLPTIIHGFDSYLTFTLTYVWPHYWSSFVTILDRNQTSDFTLATLKSKGKLQRYNIKASKINHHLQFSAEEMKMIWINCQLDHQFQNCNRLLEETVKQVSALWDFLFMVSWISWGFPLDGRVRITVTDNWTIVTSSRWDTACKVQFAHKGFGKRLNYDFMGSDSEVHDNKTSLVCKSFS